MQTISISLALVAVLASGGCVEPLSGAGEEFDVGDSTRPLGALASAPTLSMEPVSVAAVGKASVVGGTVATLDGRDMRVQIYGYKGFSVLSGQWGGPGDDWLDALDANSTGFAFVGRTAGPVQFGGVFDEDDASAVLDGTVVVKFNRYGFRRWGLAITPFTAGSTFTPTDVAVAPDGSVAVLGALSGAMDFGGVVLGACTGGHSTPAIARYSPTGAVQWVHAGYSDCGSAHPVGRRVSFDSAGNVVYAGNHRFSFSLSDCSVGGSAYHQPHVVKLSPAGTCVWARQWPVQGDVEHASLRDLTVAEKSIAITGRLPGGVAWIDFGGGALTGAGEYLVHLDDDGNHVFSGSYDLPLQVSAATDGRLFVTGRFEGTVDLGGGPITSAGAGDVILAEFSALGAYLDGEVVAGDAADQEVYDIDADSTNAPRLIGQRSDNPLSYFLAMYYP